MPSLVLNYAPDPSLAAFHDHPAFVRGVMGPLGSGKSSACVLELFRRAVSQPPGPDGVRRTRFAVVRNTYPELKTTTLKTWNDWLPDAAFPVKGSAAPLVSTCAAPLADGTRLAMETLFLALDREADTRKLLSLELTGAWVNEARELDKAVVDALTGRVGRYPPKRLGGPAWSGIIMDTNPPDEEHWWYRLAEEESPPGWAFFRQPPALLPDGRGSWTANPRAANLDHQPLGGAYWLRQAEGKAADWVKVYLLGEYGTCEQGCPVYPEYDDARHAAGQPLRPVAGLPLLLGWDFGLTPACVVAQLLPGGRLAVLDELFAASAGIRRFARQEVLPHLARRYPGFALESYGDPAGSARAQTDERTCMDELREAGLPTRAARTNAFAARREAVAGFLARFPDDRPAFLLAPGCAVLRRGFRGGYKFAEDGDPHQPRPEKNRFSHLHDALQYAALAAESALERPRRAARQAKGSRGRGAPADHGAGY